MAAKRKKRAPNMADAADIHLLYQEAVQSTEPEQLFVNQTFESIRNRQPLSLREDFCGTALAACEWVKQSKAHEAWAVDIETSVLDWGREYNYQPLNKNQQSRVHLMNADVMSVETPRVDVLQALNFSYWLWSERSDMLAYFRRAREALNSDGLFFIDAFGGFEAHKNQSEPRECDGFTYIWEQANYNPVTASMQCRIHFEFDDGSEINDAFVYDWRVWGAKELREVLIDAGFSETTLYRQAFDPETDEAIDEFIATDDAEDWACWLGYIVAKP